jgi:hypothetical protein
MWANTNYPVEPAKSWIADALDANSSNANFEELACELFDADEVAAVIRGRHCTELAKQLCAELIAWVDFKFHLRTIHRYQLEQHSELGSDYFEELFLRASRVVKIGEVTSARVVEMWNCYGLPDMPEETRPWVEAVNDAMPSPIFEDKATEIYGEEAVKLVSANFQLPGRVKEICAELIALTLFESWLEDHFEYDLATHETLGLAHFKKLFEEAVQLLQANTKPSAAEVMTLWNLHQPTLAMDPNAWRERIVHTGSLVSLQALVYLSWGSKGGRAFFIKPRDTLELQGLYNEVRMWIDFKQNLLDTRGYSLDEHPEIGFDKFKQWLARIVQVQLNRKPPHRRDGSPKRAIVITLD